MRNRNSVAIALTLTVITLAGCGDDSASDASSQVLTTDGVTAPAGDAGDVIDVTDQSDETFGKVELPDDVPLPPDHEMIQAIGNPDAGYTIIFTSPLPFGEVADFYESELPAAGWESVERQDPPGADLATLEANWTADDHGILVQASLDGTGSSVKIFTGPPGG